MTDMYGNRQLVLTKGDNNEVDDVSLYPPGQLLVGREEIVGLVKGYLPYVGWLSIGLQENPVFTGICLLYTSDAADEMD